MGWGGCHYGFNPELLGAEVNLLLKLIWELFTLNDGLEQKSRADVKIVMCSKKCYLWAVDAFFFKLSLLKACSTWSKLYMWWFSCAWPALSMSLRISESNKNDGYLKSSHFPRYRPFLFDSRILAGTDSSCYLTKLVIHVGKKDWLIHLTLISGKNIITISKIWSDAHVQLNAVLLAFPEYDKETLKTSSSLNRSFFMITSLLAIGLLNATNFILTLFYCFWFVLGLLDMKLFQNCSFWWI